MRYVDEFRNPELAAGRVRQIKDLVSRIDRRDRPLQFMEFCGGHTHTIFRYGLDQLLPSSLEMVHGPGCPVCVLPMGRIDDCLVLAERPEVIFATFGDAMRVPGSKKNLLQAKADGADVRMVYSPLDALTMARKNPDREVIFFALGFETTMPSTALTVLEAERHGVDNFSLFCNHITTLPVLENILRSDNIRLDGILAPGHVSMVVGEAPFQLAAKRYRTPIVITGFEPVDILQSIVMLLQQIIEGRCRTENQYARVVSSGGNRPGQEAMSKVFRLRDSFDWRGLGTIMQSGICMTERYARFDAESKFTVPGQKIEDPDCCRCGDVLRGRIKPWQCALFGRGCAPETPLGALMTSSEGACAAYYNYGNGAEVLNLKNAGKGAEVTA